MTTFIRFEPTVNAAFRFPATLDGQSCTVVVTWNIYRKGYYVNVFDQTSTRVFSLALVGSPPDYNLSLTAGYFTTPIVFRQTTQTFEIG